MVFQLPAWGIAVMLAWGLGRWTSIPSEWIGLGLVLYMLKDFVIFPWVKEAYEHRHHDASETLVGATARVVVTLDPKGWVQLGSERWRAERGGEGPALEIGAMVEVCELRGHTLVVRDSEVAERVLESGGSAVS